MAMTVTVQQVAALAGVSPGTVSNVLNHPAKVSEGARRRVTQAIDQLGYSRNAAARQLRSGNSPTIGLITLDLHPFFIDMVRGAVIAAEGEGLSVVVANTDDSHTREAAYIDLFREQRVFGLLVSPTNRVGPALRRLGDTPLVLVDHHGAEEFDSVSVDDHAGGRLAAAELMSIGRRRLLFVGGPPSIRQVADRLAGARSIVAAAEDAALDVLETSGLTMEDGALAGKTILEMGRSTPTGIFAANDLVALGIMQVLLASGRVRVPEEIAVVGYDDISFAAAASIPLTTVRQPGEEIGRVATEMLVQRARGGLADEYQPRAVVFTPSLVARDSTRGRATGA